MDLYSPTAVSFAHSCHHRPVRDLAWALLQRPLLSDISGMPADWLQRDYIDEQLLSWLQEQDSAPEAFYCHMEQCHSTRLGVYFEQLLSYYFCHYPRFELLAKNLQLNDHRRTVGELDFVLYDHRQQRLIHLEVAVKFYLGHVNYQADIKNNRPLHNWHNWIGPGQKDTLAIKMRHLQEHQLPLSQTQLGQSALSQWQDFGSSTNQQPMAVRLLLCGRFYFPASGNIMPPPAFAEDTSHRYSWFDSDTLITRARSSEFNTKRFCLLPRHYWLSELTRAEIESQAVPCFSATELIDYIQEGLKLGHSEWQFAEIDLNQERIEQKRFFTLNNDHLPTDESPHIR